MLILIHSKYSYIGLFFVNCIIWKNKFNQLHFCLSYLLNKSFCSNGDLNNGDLIGWTKSANIGVGEWGGSEYIKLEEIEAVVMHGKGLNAVVVLTCFRPTFHLTVLENIRKSLFFRFFQVVQKVEGEWFKAASYNK